MSWNYRVAEETHGGVKVYTIREFYYIGDKTGWTATDIAPYGETPEELKTDLERMLQAFDLPVVNIDEVEGDNG